MTKRKLRKKLENTFGKKPKIRYDTGDMEYIRAYYDYRKDENPDCADLDDITWNDLGLDHVFKRLNAGLSTSGEQYLYYQLRTPAADRETFGKRKQLVELMQSEPSLRLKLQMILYKLGRSRRADLCTAFRPAVHGFGWLLVYLFFALLLPFLIICAAVFRSMPLLVLSLITMSWNTCFREYRKRRCQDDFDTVNYTVTMVFALQKITKLKDPALDRCIADAYRNLDPLRPILRTGGVSEIRDGGFGELFASVFLLDLIAYEFLKNRIGKFHAQVFAVHEALGMIDTAIAAASYRESLSSYAVPEIHFSSAKPFITAVGMTHPLLDKAVPNDLDTHASVLITGSNASGKSTFLKTAALCAVLAQSICTVPAESYRASAFRICSSMALSDDLLAGESYYIAETKSLRRIMDRIDGKTPLLCTIDEVLRGTNTVERIAASSVTLEHIAKKGALCLAATHDIELCTLLADSFDMAHFEETVGESEMLFDYKLRHGKAQSRNAINLLRLMGFDESIVSAAHERANAYIERGVWE